MLKQREKFFLDKARASDIPSMVEIEKEYFGNYSKFFDETVMNKWFQHNPDMFYVVKDSTNKIFGFFILTPVTKKLYKEIRTGQVTDLFDFPENEVPNTFQSDYFYIADTCVTKAGKGLSHIKASFTLVKGLIQLINANAKFVSTSAITEDSFRICKNIGFEEVFHEQIEGKDNYIFELAVTEATYGSIERKIK